MFRRGYNGLPNGPLPLVTLEPEAPTCSTPKQMACLNSLCATLDEGVCWMSKYDHVTSLPLTGNKIYMRNRSSLSLIVYAAALYTIPPFKGISINVRHSVLTRWVWPLLFIQLNGTHPPRGFLYGASLHVKLHHPLPRSSWHMSDCFPITWTWRVARLRWIGTFRRGCVRSVRLFLLAIPGCFTA